MCMLKEVFYIIVSANFDREPIVLNDEPSQSDLIQLMKDLQGDSIRVEKRFILT